MKGSMLPLLSEHSKPNYLTKYKGLDRRMLHHEFRSQLDYSRFRQIIRPDETVRKKLQGRRVRIPKLAKFREGFKSSDESSILMEAGRGKLVIPTKEVAYIYQQYDQEASAPKLSFKGAEEYSHRIMKAIDARIEAQKSQFYTPLRSRSQNKSVSKLQPLRELDRSRIERKRNSDILAAVRSRSTSPVVRFELEVFKTFDDCSAQQASL
mmetsp:Transcript_30118/g.53390  ORF Transcript_30118/g.53390 Transcript_30118/m.53390 type:complete len:209 (+) Transcript_30118:507-1133(+)|eukprot:CAMPEP_0204899416 /NCGR_PEP_ID=MMETSP1397-20131031/1844_1 /ASSEMBLY_ACC=CAM_ASM_000891 /TAXON_ID=49980 /ORGANISM="Climacostomum Climacostomum virens, Strain Stock W-24" /LENGTH=208 /DNA_ID=CAMNT_0052067375 /DNA_START=494 /DNA_END=1120 /DNA_ORIENTATION=-